MHISFPEVVRIVRHAKGLELAPPVGVEPPKALSEQETLGAFLVILGRLAAQGRINENEYQFVVSEVSKKGITEEEIKILNFVIQTVSLT